MNTIVEIPFGTKDSELKGWEYIIPEGMEAVIENGKVIIREKESEDEKMMRVIGLALTDVPEERFTSAGTTLKDCLAYLEKQKDASKAIEAVERIDKYIDEHVANAHDMKDSHPDKKYYRGWDDALGKMAGTLQDVYSGEKQKEQKLAEWSEEDEDAIEQAIIAIEDMRNSSEPGTCYAGHKLSYDVVIERLKSLSPQSHWKPSEEQMKALEAAFRKDGNDEYRRTINSLYTDLQKLL